MGNEGTQDSTHSPDRSARRLLPAGVADAGFASLATFGAGLSAVILFSPDDLGVYAIFFAAFGLGVVLPWNLILVPAEVNAVALPIVERMRRAPETLRMGLRMSVVGSSSMLIAGILTRSMTDPDVIAALMVTGVVATILSPLQDYMRRILHIAGMSWRAAATSAVQFIGVALSLGVMLALDAPVAIMPFGALAVANAVSLTAALILGAVRQLQPLDDPLKFWALARDGRWLLAQALLPSVAHLTAATIIASLTSPEMLGYAEGARVVAQPVLVFATGLTAVLAPRAIEAAMNRDLRAAHRARRIYLALMLGGGAAYLLAASVDWIGNPMGYLVPVAYVIPGLVAVTIIANMATASMYLDVNELLGAKMARQMAGVSIITSPILVVVALTAGSTEAFARPLGILVRDAAELAWYRRLLSGYYRRPQQQDTQPQNGRPSAG